MKKNWILTTVGAVAALSLLAAEKKVDVSKLPPPADKKGLTYAEDIRPMFEKSCFSCHGPEKSKGDLRLDSLAAALKGSEHGKVIEVGKSEKSRLVHSVARLDPDEAMPPKGKGDPWTKEQVGLLRAWIDQGAK
ncbi:MAG: c-type cytochrome [Verrucomicrobia bacterium]|nr:c-type cytochrome [Verrucomicrobiota bacterium]